MMRLFTGQAASGLDLIQIERLGSDLSIWTRANAVSILVAFGAGTAILLVLSLLRSLGVRLCRTDRMGTGWPGIIGRVIARTHSWFMVMLSAELVAEIAAPPPGLAHLISAGFTIAMVIQAALWMRELLFGLIERRAGAATEHDHASLGSAMGLIRVLVTAALFAIALVLILDNLGVNVTGLVAGLGIGGIAIGLAAQGIFSDLFAALSIIFDKPFRVGELVKWDANVGTVEQIGLKTTRLRSVSGEQLIVSNANLLQKELRNLTNLSEQRVTIPFGLVYRTPPATCAAIPDLLAAIVKQVGKCDFVRCVMTGLGASSLDFELVFDVRHADPAVAAEKRNAIILHILETFSEQGIAFAYPTQTTYTAAPDGTMVMPWAPPAKS